MGHGESGMGQMREHGEKELMPNAQCPMPNAQSPMPNPQSPILTI
ncbi:MAG: histidine kinase [Nostoc sp.]